MYVLVFQRKSFLRLMNSFNSFKHMQHFDAHHSNQKKEKKHSIYSFSEHVQHYKSFRKLTSAFWLNMNTSQKQVEMMLWGPGTLKLFNTQNNICSLQKFNKQNVHWAAGSKLIQYCYVLLTCWADVCHVWFTVTLVYRNVQVATVTVDCIQLQGIWELVRGKWTDISAYNIDYNI